MKCREIYREENESAAERFVLSMERIREICNEEMEDKSFEEYFQRIARFICRIEKLLEKIENDWLKTVEKKYYHETLVRENKIFNLPNRKDLLKWLIKHPKTLDLMKNYKTVTQWEQNGRSAIDYYIFRAINK